MLLVPAEIKHFWVFLENHRIILLIDATSPGEFFKSKLDLKELQTPNPFWISSVILTTY